MVTSEACKKKFGEPGAKCEAKYFVMWYVPADLRAAIPCLPEKIYGNKYLFPALERFFRLAMARGVAHEIKEFNGVYSIRYKKGNPSALSLHAWAIAFDINASTNAFGKVPQMSATLAQCFRDAGFDWGGDWKAPNTDGMHGQLSQTLFNQIP